jgi:hypothetical protein
MKSRFTDPAFNPLQNEIAKLIDAAWDGYADSRKSPHTRKAGPGFADPDYDLAVDWLNARAAIAEAQKRHDDPNQKPRILIINGSSRNEHSCPGEMSKSWRMAKHVEPCFQEMGFEVDILDLSGSRRNMAGRSVPANLASPPRWRSVIGPAVATQIIHWAKPTTG